MSPAPGTPVVSAGRLGLLRIRAFRNVFLAQSISVFGDGITPVALTFAVLGLTGSGTDLGLVLAAQSLPLAALALVGGVWADRLPRAALMVASDLVRAAVQISGAVLLLTGVAQVWQLAILAAVHGAAEAFFRPAAGADQRYQRTGDRRPDHPAEVVAQAHEGVGLLESLRRHELRHDGAGGETPAGQRPHGPERQ